MSTTLQEAPVAKIGKKIQPKLVDQLKIVIVGHVDHGKSTFIGRLFYDTHSLPEGKYEQLVESCKRRGVPFEFANLMDSLQAERDQNITIDTAQIWFNTARRQVVIIDAPGHKEFLKNMITGAASAHAALLLIDANEGVQEQSRRHGYMLHLLGIKQIIVLVNKMDLKDYDQKVFQNIEKEYRAFLKQFGLEPKTFIPISAREGDNVANRSPKMPWFQGQTVLEAIDGFEPAKPSDDLPLRFPLQDIYRFDHRRILAGRIVSGTIKVGDKLVFAPGTKTSVVKSIERWNPAVAVSDEVKAGESVGITLTEQIFVERGQVAFHETNPVIQKRQFKARLFWMGRNPLRLKKKYKIKLTTQEVECEIKSIDKIIDASTLGEVAEKRDYLLKNDVAELTIQTRYPLAFDNSNRVVETGRFVIVDDREVSGGGIISGEEYPVRSQAAPKSDNISWSKAEITYNDRSIRNRHAGGVLWLTGLSGAGKSAIAHELEKELFARGMQCYSLDGDNLRFGLNSDLGFSPEDRSENIRRAAEVARLLADSGQIVITSFISPYRTDRTRVREIMKENDVKFFEIFVSCPVQICEERDPKGLYKKARAGEIAEFTGITAPYEQPETPEITVHTNKQSLAESVTQVLESVLPAIQVKAEGAESFEI